MRFSGQHYRISTLQCVFPELITGVSEGAWFMALQNDIAMNDRSSERELALRTCDPVRALIFGRWQPDQRSSALSASPAAAQVHRRARKWPCNSSSRFRAPTCSAPSTPHTGWEISWTFESSWHCWIAVGWKMWLISDSRMSEIAEFPWLTRPIEWFRWFQAIPARRSLRRPSPPASTLERTHFST